MNKFVTYLATLTTTEHMREALTLLQSYRNDESYIHITYRLLFTNWAKIDPHAALEEAMKPHFRKMNYRENILIGWSEVNPEDAARYLQEIIKEKGAKESRWTCSSSIRAIGNNLARKSPDEAWRWMSDLNLPIQEVALEGFINGVLKSHPDRMLEFAGKLLPEDGLPESVEGGDYCRLNLVVALWSRIDYPGALEWSRSLRGEWKNNAVKELIYDRIRVNIEDAMELVKELPKKDAIRSVNMAERGVFETRDVGKIVSWMVEVGEMGLDGELAEIDVISGSMDLLGAKKMRELLEKLPSNDTRDKLIRSYLWKGMEMDKKYIVRLVNEIKNEEIKEEAIGYIKEGVDINFFDESK